MLLNKGKITQDMIDLMNKWRHSGFNVYCGPRILPWQKNSIENLARGTWPTFLWRIIRASFSQERMTYIREAGQVVYQFPCILEPVESLKVERPELTSKAFRKTWARLIQKIYQDDYLIDPDRSTLSFDPEALDGRLSTGYPLEAYL